MRFGKNKKAIPLRVFSWERQIAGRSIGLSHVAFIPEPTAGYFVLAAADVAIVTNRILIVGNRSNSVDRADECSGSSSRVAATALAGSGNQKRAAKSCALQIDNINGDGIDLSCSQSYGLAGIGSGSQQSGRGCAIGIPWEGLDGWRQHRAIWIDTISRAHSLIIEEPVAAKFWHGPAAVAAKDVLQ